MHKKVNNQNIKNVRYAQYLQNGTAPEFKVSNDIIDNGYFKTEISEWQTSTIKAHLMQSHPDRAVSFTGQIEKEFVILHFVLSGEFYIKPKNEQPIIIKQNTNNVLYTPRGSLEHKFKENLGNTFFRVYLLPDFIRSKAEQYTELFETIANGIEGNIIAFRKENILTTPQMKVTIQQIMQSQEMGNLASFYFETKIQELLALQMQQAGSVLQSETNSYKNYKKQVNEAKSFIETHYDHPLTIAALAQNVGMSETTLKAAFKSYFGTTVYSHLFNCRMEAARSFLADNSLSVAEVALKTGYEHASHFATAFKRKYGLSPLEFREHPIV